MAAPTRVRRKTLRGGGGRFPRTTGGPAETGSRSKNETAQAEAVYGRGRHRLPGGGQDQGKQQQQQEKQQVSAHQCPTPVAGKPPADPGTGQQSGQENGNQHSELKVNIPVNRLGR